MANRLLHTMIRVRDLDRSVRFYREALELEVTLLEQRLNSGAVSPDDAWQLAHAYSELAELADRSSGRSARAPEAFSR